jgi:hypothetical protein
MTFVLMNWLANLISLIISGIDYYKKVWGINMWQTNTTINFYLVHKSKYTFITTSTQIYIIIWLID